MCCFCGGTVNLRREQNVTQVGDFGAPLPGDVGQGKLAAARKRREQPPAERWSAGCVRRTGRGEAALRRLGRQLGTR